jgi:hypothetical protein
LDRDPDVPAPPAGGGSAGGCRQWTC